MSYHCTVIKLGVITLGVITLGVVTLGVITLGVITLGVITLGVITLGVITLGVITLGVITVSRQAYTVALPSMCIARQTFFKEAKTKQKICSFWKKSDKTFERDHQAKIKNK